MKRHQWLPWVIVLAVVVIAVAIVTSLDRFVEWDEAVFYSQSGGFKGTSPPQLPLAPSREGGPGFLIGVIRVSGLGLIGVRVVFVAIALSIAGFAYWRLSHHFSRLAGPSALAAFGLSWLSLAYLGSLYGSVLNGVLLVLAAVLLIDIAFGELPTSRLIGLGLLLGLAVSGAFWMRQIESVIGVAALVVVSMVMERSVIWRRNAAAVTAAVVTFLVVFVIPWVVWSTRIFGSVAGRLDALSAQMSGNADMHWGNGLTKYVEALSGTLRTYGIFDEVPRWPRWIMLVSLVLVGSTLAVAVLDRRTTRRQRWTIFACAAPAVALFIFFVFLYSSVEVRERYMANLMPFAAALVGMGVAWAWDRRGTIRSPSVRATLISGFAVLVCMWAIAQVAIAIPFQQARVLDAETTLVTSNTIRAFVEDQPCVGASRYSRVQIQLGTGCAVGGVTSEESAILRASEFEIGRVGAFIVWPTRLDLGEEWTVIDRSSEAGSAFLHLLQREGD